MYSLLQHILEVTALQISGSDLLCDHIRNIWCKITICKLYFKPLITHNTETWTYAQRNRSTMHVMHMKFMRSTETTRKRNKMCVTFFKMFLEKKLKLKFVNRVRK
jgi:hypothetical protein